MHVDKESEVLRIVVKAMVNFVEDEASQDGGHVCLERRRSRFGCSHSGGRGRGGTVLICHDVEYECVVLVAQLGAAR